MSPLASLLAEPLRNTSAPGETVCVLPARAMGAEFEAEAVTTRRLAGLVLTPSLTVSASSYLPATSGVKLGRAVAAPARVARLPAGFETRVQE